MSSHDAVGATREASTSLTAAVLRVRGEYGDTLDARWLTSDIDRIQADLDELGPPARGHRPGVRPEDMIVIPDDPSDESMWQAAQSEAQHAP